MATRGGRVVTLVADGEIAWQRLEVETFDVVVSEVNMPVIDGVELCRRSKADERVRKVPFVLLAAEGDGDVADLGLEAGADEVLSKPWAPAALIERVARAMHAVIP